MVAAVVARREEAAICRGGASDTPHLYVMDADGSNRRQLTDAPGFSEEYADWSPDGTKIAVGRSHGRDSSIWVINADGSNPVRVTSGPQDQRACWSPDGGQIAFARARTPGLSIGHWRIFVIRADGTNERRLTESDMDDMSAAWSPDGSRIAYESTGGGNSWRGQIWVMNADGSNQTQLTRSEFRLGWPSWSPDGKRIVFTRAPYNTWDNDIWVMEADGTNHIQLTNTPGIPDSFPDWSPFLGQRVVVPPPRPEETPGVVVPPPRPEQAPSESGSSWLVVVVIIQGGLLIGLVAYIIGRRAGSRRAGS